MDGGRALLAEGAEARITEEVFLGVPAVRKVRPGKAYRPEDLDRRLRLQRMRTEVRLLREARRVGVATPLILDVDEATFSLVLERLPGRPLTELLGPGAGSPSEQRALCRQWGTLLGRLHASGIAHGDLTASNVLWDGQRLTLLDLSLGTRDPELEELGIDLHLVEEDLNTLSAGAQELLRAFLSGYESSFSGARESQARAQEIRGRIRYA